MDDSSSDQIMNLESEHDGGGQENRNNNLNHGADDDVGVPSINDSNTYTAHPSTPLLPHSDTPNQEDRSAYIVPIQNDDDDDDDDDNGNPSVVENNSNFQQQQQPSSSTTNTRHYRGSDGCAGAGNSNFFRSLSITPIDLTLLRNLETDYQAAALQTTAQDRAQRIWACRAGLASTVFMGLYFLVATLVLFELANNYHYNNDEETKEEWTVLNIALFVVYTATTVGYGHITPPDTTSYYLFNIFNILLGMAALAIMVAQVFMWMALEARRIRDSRRAIALANKSRTTAASSTSDKSKTTTTTRSSSLSILTGKTRFIIIEQCLPWFQETAFGGFLSVSFSLSVITLIGALPIGALEGWSVLRSIYFGIVSMATVGYGDMVPETTAGIIITIIWLPLNILFTAIYMGSIARWYLNFSARNISSIKKKLNDEAIAGTNIDRSFLGTLQRTFQRRGVGDAVVVVKRYLSAGGGGGGEGGDKALPTTDLIQHRHGNGGNDDDTASEASSSYSLITDFIKTDGRTKLNHDYDSIELSSNSAGDDHFSGNALIMRGPKQVGGVENANSGSLTSMKDLIDAVRDTITSSSSTAAAVGDTDRKVDWSSALDPIMNYLSLPSIATRGSGDQPSLALRVLVQERLAHIVAYEICGAEHHVDVKDTYIVFQISQWRDVLKKWKLPSGSWKAFRAAALQAMILVGEKSLLRDGPIALFELTPDEFHSIFSPVVAAMGTADTLDGWLHSTEDLSRQQVLVGFIDDSNCHPIGGGSEAVASLPSKEQKVPGRLIVAQDSIRIHKISRNPFPKSKCLPK